jgi:hypothetical protein
MFMTAFLGYKAMAHFALEDASGLPLASSNSASGLYYQVVHYE